MNIKCIMEDATIDKAYYRICKEIRVSAQLSLFKYNQLLRARHSWRGNAVVWFTVVKPWLMRYFIETNILNKFVCNFIKQHEAAQRIYVGKDDTYILSDYLDNQFFLYYYRIHSIIDDTIIGHTFSWSMSNEGFYYWREVDYNLKNATTEIRRCDFYSSEYTNFNRNLLASLKTFLYDNKDRNGEVL